jgi:hypothetical protein
MARQVGVSRARIQEGVDEDEEVSIWKNQAESKQKIHPQWKIVGGGKLNFSPKNHVVLLGSMPFAVGAVIFSWKCLLYRLKLWLGCLSSSSLLLLVT